jgi:hypothetical protein
MVMSQFHLKNQILYSMRIFLTNRLGKLSKRIAKLWKIAIANGVLSGLIIVANAVGGADSMNLVASLAPLKIAIHLKSGLVIVLQKTSVIAVAVN